MSTIISRPIKDFCAFNAVGNPIVYTIERSDSGFNFMNDVGGFAQLEISAFDNASFWTIGNTIYISKAGYNLTAHVTASTFTGGNTYVTTDTPYIPSAGSSGGHANNLDKRTDYRIEVEVFDYDTNESLGPRITSNPDNAGIVKINISGIVSSYIYANWSPASGIESEEETFKKVYIKTEDYFDGEYTFTESDDAHPIFCVFAMINLLLGYPPDFKRYPHGGNMLSFFPGTELKQWITRLPAVSMWRGWPFTISFISPYVSLKRRVKQNDSTGTEIDNTVQSFSVTEGVNRMDIGTLQDNAKELIVTLESADGLVQITRPLTVKVKDPCLSPVLLFWKNSLGGDALWMFDESQEYVYAYPSGRKVTRMKLYTDNLVLGEWDAINELNSPTDVIASNITDYGMDDSIDKTHFRNDNQVFIINQDGEKVGVIVIETDNTTKTMYKKHAAEITIELPELFTV